MNVWVCVIVEDVECGIGYCMVLCELFFYVDLKIGEIFEQWENFWIGKMVDVIYVVNDLVNLCGLFFLNGLCGLYKFDVMIQGSKGWMIFEVFFFYENFFGGLYQQYVGGIYQVIEMFSFYFDFEDFISVEMIEFDDVQVGWVCMLQWLFWMEMGLCVGQMMFYGVGCCVVIFEEMLEILIVEIEKNYLFYKQLFVFDDNCLNEMSWIYFKKKFDE